MEARKNYFTTRKTARYYTLGELHERTRHVWIVCHGYGQLAEFFIHKFLAIADEETFVIAPEGLNRFYLQGFSGRVGATWMTRVERESEIRDYVEYLNSLYNSLQIPSNAVVTVLGFSQGVPSVCRWLAGGKARFDRLILWAGIFPPDLGQDFQTSVETFLKDKKVFLVYGNQDPLLLSEHKTEMGLLKKLKLDMEIIQFEGGHEVDELTLTGLKK